MHAPTDETPRSRAHPASSPARAWPQRALDAGQVAYRVTQDAVQGWIAHEDGRLGASIAFYAIFALAPTLLIAVSIAGAVFGADAARGYVFGQLEGLVGPEAAATAQALLKSAWRDDNGGWATLVAFGTLLVGATGVFVELHNALNRVWDVQPAPQEPAWTLMLRARVAALALVLALGFLSIVSLLLSAVISGIAAWFHSSIGYEVLLRVLDNLSSLLILSLAFGLLLRWLPDRAPPRRAVVVGAVASAILFTIGKNVIGLYLGRASVTSAYGAAGSYVVLILWVYYSAQLLLFGAELGRATAHHHGEHSAPRPERTGETV